MLCVLDLRVYYLQSPFNLQAMIQCYEVIYGKLEIGPIYCKAALGRLQLVPGCPGALQPRGQSVFTHVVLGSAPSKLAGCCQKCGVL